jgi:hypothetical protein
MGPHTRWTVIRFLLLSALRHPRLGASLTLSAKGLALQSGHMYKEIVETNGHEDA